MKETNSLTIFTKAALMLAEADTMQKAKELKDMAIVAGEWAKRKGMGEQAIQHCRSYALEAERKMGEILAQPGMKNPGTRPSKKDGGHMVLPPSLPTITDLGLTKRESADCQALAALPRETFDAVKSGAKTRADVKRESKRQAVVENLENVKVKAVKELAGVYDVIVIDPPWPMEKIEREVRPNQVAFDYPTMSIESITHMQIPHAEDCHIWIWTTHRFLPDLFAMIHTRRLAYVCTFVWHKPGGFQPIGLPQYNCEFVVYCRYGKPKFIDTKAFPVCFNAARGAHSEKPGEFYDVVRRVTAGRRLDMYNRRKIEGFDGWGQETK